MSYFLGYDIGSSAIKVALLDAATGKPLASAFSPESEMPILSPRQGYAEQDPDQWFSELVQATAQLQQRYPFLGSAVLGIGISYQMHGLVCIDKNLHSLRPSIIWCDSRAVDIGNDAFSQLGEGYCLQHLLNSPGNFTASKLKWVKDNQPAIFSKIYKILLPGDYIAMRLTGEVTTTVSGLSEGILWNYQEGEIAYELLKYYGLPVDLLATQVPAFGEQGRLTKEAASALDLPAGIPIAYRAGDQPNNAWSLNVLEPGEIAATAGTSGVIYGVTDKISYDEQSRVNTFVHVNHRMEKPRYGVLLCVNGTGILNSWVRKNFFQKQSYDAINQAAAAVPIGSDGLQFLPFGNGAERMLKNKDLGAGLFGLQFNRHDRQHVARAAQEGIAFSLYYGSEIMRAMGLDISTVRAGRANMFLSDVFASTFANISNCNLELFNTDGAVGAARGAALGTGFYKSAKEAFQGMQRLQLVEPNATARQQTKDTYESWREKLTKLIQ